MPDFTRVNGLAAFALLIAAGAAPPAVSPIHAQLVESEFATHYTVTAQDPSGKTLTYQWRLIPPTTDAGCNHFSATGNTAVWHHGDQDGCNHNVQVARGHPGTVIVVVSDGSTSCTATYFGTVPGDGPAPQCGPFDQATPAAVTSPGVVPAAPHGIPPWQVIVAVVVFLAVAGGVGWFLIARLTREAPGRQG